MKKPILKTADCSQILSKFIGDIEVFGLCEIVEYGNGGPGGFGGPGDHNGLADMLQNHSSGAEAELTFHLLDMAVDDGKLCDREAVIRLCAHAKTLSEPLQSELLSYLPEEGSAHQGIGFYDLHSTILENHPIVVLKRYDSAWDLTFHVDFEKVLQVNWTDDSDGVPDELKEERVLCVVQGGIGYFELTFEALLGWLNLEPGYGVAEFNRELRELCFKEIFDLADEFHFGSHEKADLVLWEVAKCLLDSFFTPRNTSS